MLKTVSLLTLALGLAVNGYSQTFLTNGLVAYYPFNGNANDASGNGHNATVNTNTVLTTDRFGNTKAAFHFQNAIMQFANIPVNLAGSYSFGMWMRLNNYDEGYAIGELNDTNFYCNANPVIHQGNGNVTYAHCGGGGGEPGDGPLSFGPASEFLNVWHHLFVSVAEGGQTTVYRDGQITTNKLTAFPMTTFANLTLGDAGNLSAGYQNSNVDLDDVRIYNRALSASEVQQLYAYESVPQCILTDGLVAYYPFNGNAIDASGNGNNGTVVNALLATDRFGLTSNCFSFFPQSQSYIQLLSESFPKEASPMTVSFWMKIENPSLPGGGNFSVYPVFSVLQDPENRWDFNFVYQANGVTFTPNTRLWLTNVWEGGYSVWSIFPSFPSSTNWHHFAIVFGTNNDCSFLLDGVWRQTTPSSITNYLRPSGTWFIGTTYGGSSFSGRLDDIRIYNRALSTNEVQQLYQYEAAPRLTLTLMDSIGAVTPSFSNLILGVTYQLQVSDDLKNWYSEGPPFKAASNSIAYPLYFGVDFWNQLFFRLQMSP